MQTRPGLELLLDCPGFRSLLARLGETVRPDQAEQDWINVKAAIWAVAQVSCGFLTMYF